MSDPRRRLATMSDVDLSSSDCEYSRRGANWTEAEDAQLCDEIRAGRDEETIATAHGRSTKAIRARAARLLRPQQVRRSQAVEVLREHLLDDPSSFARAGRDETSARGEQSDEMPSSAARVLAIWRTITEETLSSTLQDEFLRRPEARALANHADELLVAAGLEIWKARGRLRLGEWAQHCEVAEPSEPPISAQHIIERRPEAGGAVLGLVSEAVEDLRNDRDREVLIRRLGLRTSEPQTLQDVGTEFGVSRERVRQLQHRALTDLTRKAKRGDADACARANLVLASLLGSSSNSVARAVLLTEIAELSFPRVSTALITDVLMRLAGYERGETRTHIAAEVSTLARTRRGQIEQEMRRQEFQDRKDHLLNRLLAAAEWPDSPGRSTGAAAGLVPLRDPPAAEEDRRWYSPKLDRAVAFESKPELTLIQLLDQCGDVVDFCEQPIAVEYDLDGSAHTYYPDLWVHLIDGRSLIVEVKGSVAEAALWVNRAKFSAVRERCRANGWGFLLTDGSRTLENLTGRVVAASIENVLAAHLAANELNWTEIKVLREKHGFTQTDLAALALRNGWQIRLNPWRIKAP